MDEQSKIISFFLENVVGQTAETAREFLQAANWNVEEALDNARKLTGFLESDKGAASIPTTKRSRQNLASLYRPPYHLMFNGSFEMAKDYASDQDKWLLVNLQSTKQFSSHMLNRDTWGNEVVSQTISNYCIFWQVYDDTTECRKVCNYYKLDSTPAVLVIDPITGQKMRLWRGMVEPGNLLEDIVPFMDSSPKNQHSRLRGSASMKILKNFTEVTSTVYNREETCITQKSAYPPLPEEPEVDKALLCRVGIRLPNGCRLRRNFLLTDQIQLLWSFCYSQLEEAETRQFRLTQGIPGALKTLDYESIQTFEEAGLANSMISVTWE